MNKSVLVPLIIAIITMAVFVFVAKTLTTVWVFVPATIITYIIYLNTFYKRVPDPGRILPLYLLLLGIQLIHFTEEYLTDFTTEIPGLFGQEAYPMDYWITFNMVAYSIFIMGGIVLFKQIKELMIIPMFFIFAGVIFNSIAHILLAIYVGGYFSGLYTALIYAVLSPSLMKRVLEDTKVNSASEKSRPVL